MSVVCVPQLGHVTLSGSFSPMVVQWFFASRSPVRYSWREIFLLLIFRIYGKDRWCKDQYRHTSRR